MPSLESLKTGLNELRAVGRILPLAARGLPGRSWSASSLLAMRAQTDPNGLGLAYEDRRYTWADLERQANRYARALRDAGVRRGHAVALLMDNRPEFLFTLSALNRLGAVAALINTSIAGRGLTHAIGVASSRRVVVGSEHVDKVREVLSTLEGLGRDEILVQHDEGDAVADDLPSLDARVADQSDAPLEGLPPTKAEELMCYIYTSGTTGLPKAAIIKNQRWLMAGAMFGGMILELTPRDVIYVALPLYHSNAMFAGWAAALQTGAGIALRRKFSASRFWDDVRRYDASAFVYIGELCRYLLNQPEDAADGRHRLRVITGNGLRPDIWDRFQSRFRIPLIREFYGATEGNVPLVNLDGKPGMVGRLHLGQAIVRCDLETGEIARNAAGRCDRVGPGGTGLLVAKIAGPATYDGYVDAEATKKKIMQDVFKRGDAYFNTGDLLTLHEDGWISFADRVGDTFRWKGENVSTTEVAETLNGAPGVLESNVYGVAVPGAEGRAGMVSLNCGPEFSIDTFNAFVIDRLPVFQRPYFVRIQSDMRITGTFKHQKVDYRSEGYDPARVADPLYFLDGEKYVPLDQARYEGLESGRVALR